jgi:hypothetical protein
MSDTILWRVWKVRVKRSVEKPMMNSNTEKEFSLAERIVAMRQLTAEDISKVSGGMMNRGEGSFGGGTALGGAGEQVWETWTSPFWHY